MRSQAKVIKKICGTCGCWSQPNKANADGNCRALPPTASGWPGTRDADWCVAGWIEDTRNSVPDNSMSIASDLGQVGLNYAYIRDYSDDACTWLECVMEAPDAIPMAVRHILANPLEGGVTARLPAWKDCDELLNWALNEPGGDNPALGDESGIFCYLDTPEERAQNLAILGAFEESHPWVVLCKRLAAETAACV